MTGCPRSELHTPGPTSFLARYEWALGMSKTHRQRQCPGCSLWLIWEPKEPKP